MRYISAVNHLNTLAVYMRQGGKVFLFDSGTTAAIVNGFLSRVSSATAATFPYKSGDDPRADLLRPGNFLFDFVHLRSELDTGDRSGSTFTQNLQLKSCIPYLPEFGGPASQTDRTHDPRIGPAAARNLTLWSGLPRLTIAAYRGANVDPDQRALSKTFFVSQPLFEVEGVGANTVSVMDTLYLFQAREYDPLDLNKPVEQNGSAPDGKPNAVYYHGVDGQSVWLGFAPYHFELDQIRTVFAKVLTNLGLQPLPAGMRPGAHPVIVDRQPQPVRRQRLIAEGR